MLILIGGGTAFQEQTIARFQETHNLGRTHAHHQITSMMNYFLKNALERAWQFAAFTALYRARGEGKR